ncbi:unnamed protein product [Caretta caretta]
MPQVILLDELDFKSEEVEGRVWSRGIAIFLVHKNHMYTEVVADVL